MNLSILKGLGGPTVRRGLLKVSKYAPEILTGVGVAGIVTSTVLIARASTKLEPITLDYRELRSDLKERRDNDQGYADQDYKKDLALIYGRQSLDLLKLYGPGASLSAMSIVSILAAHGIMRRRAVALLGAYKALETAFEAYRQRVIEELGEEKDRDFRLGLRTEVIEDGGKKKTVRSIDPSHYSIYAKFFDPGNSNWKPDPEYNLAFLKNTQNWANDKLRIQKFLFLNDVYDMLDLERTSQGQIVGWVMDPNNGGDLHIDFNIFTADSIKARDFVNGLEDSILLDFNVDGVIIDLI